MNTTINRIAAALAGPSIAGGILLGGLTGLALSAAAPASAAPIGAPTSTCVTTATVFATPNTAGALTRPAAMSKVQPSTAVYVRPSACFGN